MAHRKELSTSGSPEFQRTAPRGSGSEFQIRKRASTATRSAHASPKSSLHRHCTEGALTRPPGPTQSPHPASCREANLTRLAALISMSIFLYFSSLSFNLRVGAPKLAASFRMFRVVSNHLTFLGGLGCASFQDGELRRLVFCPPLIDGVSSSCCKVYLSSARGSHKAGRLGQGLRLSAGRRK